MRCPVCKKSSLDVMESRTTEKHVRRRRRCKLCEYRFTTLEMPSREWEQFKIDREKMEKIKCQLKHLNYLLKEY